MQNKKRNSKNKGITLVALVITIVVLVILATITIQEVSGDGIISRAKAASFRTEMTQARENLELSKLEMQMVNNYTSNIIEEMINGGKLEQVAVADLQEFDEQLKFEIIYWGKYDLGISKISKNYIKNNLQSILNDIIVTENIPNLYYIKNGVNKVEYLYDSNGDIIYKIKSTSIGINKVHSIQELDYVGIGDNLKERDSLLTKISKKNEIIEVAGKKCYSPDLTGLVEANTKAVYYETTIDETGKKTVTGNFVELPIIEYLETKSITAKDYENYEFYDYNNNMWANIKVENSGIVTYWVWIPRYAYKIEEITTETGKEYEMKIKFIDLENNDLEAGNLLDTSKYIVHSAFEDNGASLTGIWIGKYESSTIANLISTASEEFYVPDLTGLDENNTYIEVYNEKENKFEGTKLADIENINDFANKNNWYDYEKQVWANIKVVADGVETWWVWIPRYAYSIIGETISVKFVDLKGNPLDGSTLGTTYIQHPAFNTTDESGNEIKLKGIWISKYESSEK